MDPSHLQLQLAHHSRLVKSRQQKKDTFDKRSVTASGNQFDQLLCLAFRIIYQGKLSSILQWGKIWLKYFKSTYPSVLYVGRV